MLAGELFDSDICLRIARMQMPESNR